MHEIMIDQLDGTILKEIKMLVSSVEGDYIKARKGSKLAGVRVRKVLLHIKKLTHQARKEISGYRILTLDNRQNNVEA